MARTRLIPQSQRTPSLSGGIIRYYDRGRWLTRSWPRKRGKPKSLKVQNQNQWFKDTVQLLKFAPERQQRIAIDLARDTGLYPHDVMMLAAAGNLYELINPDGSVFPKWVPKVNKAVFTGARLLRTSNMALAAGVNTQIPWQSAALDTAGFWDIGDPTKLTIPTGVNVVELFAGIDADDTSLTFRTVLIEMSGAGQIARQDGDQTGNFRTTTSTGPIAVAPGISFTARVFSSQARNILATQKTYFSLNVLDAL